MAAGRGRKPIVVEGLVHAEPTVMAWADGERELWWSRAAALDHGLAEPDWGLAATGADRLSDLTPPQASWLITTGPDAPARALLATSAPIRYRQQADLSRVAVARFELDALPPALRDAGENADRLGFLLLPYRGPEAAALVAGWLRHLGSARLWARLWLARHPEAAAAALIPAAAGRPGKPRQNAEEALRHLAVTGHRHTVLTAADGYGAAALDAITALLEDAGDTPAARKVRAPAWARADLLPEIRTADGGILPAEDTARLIDGLIRTRLDDAPEPPPGDPAPADGRQPGVESSAAAQPLVAPPGPGTRQLIAACDRASLAAFGRALFDAWTADGMPAAEAWAVLAQAHLGDDATMEAVAPQVRSWPGRSRWARAIDGFAVLATVGTDTALRHLLAIEEGMSGGAMNDRALDYLTRAAGRRGLSVTGLADRLTVTHGLETGVVLDYGAREFTVVVDEHLTASVRAADGRVLARPPKPGVKDARPDAYQKFLILKKDLRATAVAQIARLEREMHTHRRRPARDLPGVVLPHPVLGPIARRLLWGEYDAEDRLVRAVRIAEDGSFADVHDTTATVGGDAPLGIVHPAELGIELGTWAHTFTDYEILQPFPQVHRPVVTLTATERTATSLTGFGPVPTERVVALMRDRWAGNAYQSASRRHTQLSHPLPGGLTLLVQVEPGVTMTGQQVSDEQRITEIWADDAWSDHWQRARRVAMGDCDAAALSELLVELHTLIPS
ncbi:DUF4132 domain-containing protein [Actinoplanes sp. NPDC051851]|uniref:DUF4132 domain-containing protein n=1 Tax=Actinoplanes sp. NPDC051851 TaxID=3154753 RepID=UPI00343D47F9